MTAIIVHNADRADVNSYRADLPTWEPVMTDLVTDDGRNLTRDIGVRLIRQSDTMRPVATVGMDYTIHSHDAIARGLDALLAPFGGRAVCGPAKVWSGRVVSATVKLPEAIASVLSVGVKDKSKRAAGITYRSSHDGSYKAAVHLWAMRLACSNGAVLPVRFLDASRKHTEGIGWLPEQIKAAADRVPLEIEAYAGKLRTLSARVIDRDTLADVAKRIAGASKPVAEKIIDMVLGANGEYVPTTDAVGTYTALQVFEAATAFDRHHRSVRKDGAEPGAVRMNRLLDGDTFGSKAWDVLSTL